LCLPIGGFAQPTTTVKTDTRTPSAQEVTESILKDIGTKEANTAVDKRKRAIKEAIDGQLTPDEIIRYKEFMEARERARAGIYSKDLVGKIRSVQILPSAVSAPNEIRISAATSSTLVFTDAAGTPWKILDAFAPGELCEARRNGHLLTLLPPKEGGLAFGRGNLTVVLDGLVTVLVFGLSSGLSKEIDYTLNVQVLAQNPNEPTPITKLGTTLEADPDFPAFLDGTPPDGAKELRSSHSATQAWQYRNAVYVRTPLALHSPAFQLRAAGASGIAIYRFDKNPGIINAIRDGRVIPISLGD
ncbi:MAG: hypothetical protein JNM52_05675, partial [Betaproteobacteria bacterium]|nr:hypothetical protein [Betaproteobacteria bacterium]